MLASDDGASRFGLGDWANSGGQGNGIGDDDNFWGSGSSLYGGGGTSWAVGDGSSA